MEVTTPNRRRLSVGATPTPEGRARSVRDNDDADERRKRRRSHVLEARRKSMRLFSPSKATAPEDRTHNPEVLSIISKVIKLSAENKINVKNSWEVPLPLVEHHDFEDNSTGDTNFQRAGCALDAGAKIYGYRVEDTHKRSTRILQALLRSEATDEDGTEGTGARAASRRAGVAATLETNMGTITQDHTAAGPVLDPTYRRISKAFDAAGARGMLLSNLPVRDGCAVTLDAGPAEHGADGAYPGQGGSAPRSPSARGRRRSSLAAATTPGARSPADAFASVYRGPGPGEEEGQGGDMQIDVTDLRAVLADIGANVDRLTLCPALDGMYKEVGSEGVAELTPEELASPGHGGQGLDLPPPSGADSDHESEFSFGGGQGEDFADGDDFAPGFEGVATAAHGGADIPSFGDASPVPLARSMVQGASGDAATAGAPAVAVMEAMLLESVGSDYSFFDQRLLGTWAGPEHWKFVRSQGPRRPGAAQQTDGEGGSRPARVRREPFTVDFTTAAPVPARDFAPPPRSRQATLISAGALARRKPRMLPVDFHYDVSDAVRLYLRPKALVRRLQSAPCMPQSPQDASASAASVGSFVALGSTSGAPSKLDAALEARFQAAAAGVGGAYGVSAAGAGFVDAPSFGSSTASGDASDSDDGFDGAGEDALGGEAQAQGPGGFLGTGLRFDDAGTEGRDWDELRISYTKRAKRVDVRLLKRGMLHSLERRVGRLAPVTPSEGDEGENAPTEAVATPSKACTEVNFTDIVQELAPDMGPDATVPFYFICALHLANERGLRLQSNPAMNSLVLGRD